MDSEGEMVKTRLVFIQPWAWIIGVAWAWYFFTPPFSRLDADGYDGGAWPALRRSVLNNKSIIYVFVAVLVLAEAGEEAKIRRG